jgi:hypothetical protein
VHPIYQETHELLSVLLPVATETADGSRDRSFQVLRGHGGPVGTAHHFEQTLEGVGQISFPQTLFARVLVNEVVVQIWGRQHTLKYAVHEACVSDVAEAAGRVESRFVFNHRLLLRRCIFLSEVARRLLRGIGRLPRLFELKVLFDRLYTQES